MSLLCRAGFKTIEDLVHRSIINWVIRINPAFRQILVAVLVGDGSDRAILGLIVGLSVDLDTISNLHTSINACSDRAVVACSWNNSAARR